MADIRRISGRVLGSGKGEYRTAEDVGYRDVLHLKCNDNNSISNLSSSKLGGKVGADDVPSFPFRQPGQPPNFAIEVFPAF